MSSYGGALCRVVLYSNLAFGVVNEVSLEFTTPQSVDPDGAFICALCPSVGSLARWCRSLLR